MVWLRSVVGTINGEEVGVPSESGMGSVTVEIDV